MHMQNQVFFTVFELEDMGNYNKNAKIMQGNQCLPIRRVFPQSHLFLTNNYQLNNFENFEPNLSELFFSGVDGKPR